MRKVVCIQWFLYFVCKCFVCEEENMSASVKGGVCKCKGLLGSHCCMEVSSTDFKSSVLRNPPSNETFSTEISSVQCWHTKSFFNTQGLSQSPLSRHLHRQMKQATTTRAAVSSHACGSNVPTGSYAGNCCQPQVWSFVHANVFLESTCTVYVHKKSLMYCMSTLSLSCKCTEDWNTDYGMILPLRDKSVWMILHVFY